MGKVQVRSSPDPKAEARDVYVPLTPKPSLLKAGMKVAPPAPGVIVYRHEESFIYPNSARLNAAIVDYVKANMRRGRDMSAIRLSDRPWNDPGPRNGHDENAENLGKPTLHAIVLDFSGVYVIDIAAP